MVEGRLFQVERLDFDGRKAFVRQIDCDYYTDAITYSRVTILDTFEEGSPQGLPEAEGLRPRPRDAIAAAQSSGGGAPRAVSNAAAHGEVHVVSRVVGFKKIKFYTNENVGSGELDLPEQQMHTTAYWITIPAALMGALPFAADDRRDGVLGLAFALRQIAQLLLMCDRQDIGLSIDTGESTGGGEVVRAADASPRIFVYDNYPGGIGFSEPLYRMHTELLTATRRLIADCPCEQGCPACVGPAGATGLMAKVAASRILDLLLAS
jgi:DEAD/DEAH box helicase domain-containing protein